MEEQTLRQQLIKHLEGGDAFMTVDQMVKEIPFDKLGTVPDGLPYSFYQQFYHLRFAQYDILDFSRNPDYESLDWPDDYWPGEAGPENKKEWEELKEKFFSERSQLADLIADTGKDLFEAFPHGTGQTLLREAILAIEHNAYHTGQLLIILRLLGCHKDD